jgi:hypothetical protein
MRGVYGAFAATPAFGQLLREKNVSHALFGTQNLEITGSQVPNRGPNDILADYFGLSPLFDSTVLLKPFMRTGLLDLALYVGWNNFYFRIHAPAVWTQWKLGMCEEIEDDGTETTFPALYMDFDAIPAPAPSFSKAVQGGFTYGQVTQTLAYGKFNHTRTLGGLSDIQMALGWNFVNHTYGFAGLNLRVSAPTGSRPNSQFLFEPIVGNGKHWEFGLGFAGRALLWDKDGTQHVNLYGDINAMHLCNTRQKRSFDLLVNGFGSRNLTAAVIIMVTVCPQLT